jgi:phage-related protein
MKGIRFDALHSDDLGLILGKKEISTPPVKKAKIDIPGADGDLDQTDFFGEPKFENRTLRFEFTANTPASDFLSLYSRVNNALHGKKKRIILDDDPLYFYQGRCYVDKHTDEKGVAKIDIECDCGPYKLKKDHTVSAYVLDGTEKIITLTNGRKRAVPEVQIYTESGSLRIVYQGNIWDLGPGIYTLPELELVQGENTVTVTGTGTITFTWQEGDL